MTAFHRSRFYTYFWGIDPGFFQLQHALKSVFAIVLSLWLVRDKSLSVIVMSGIASGISMQGFKGNTFLSRLVYVGALDAVYGLVFLLGFLVRGAPYWTGALLVTLGFAVNYARRFGFCNSRVPMMIWTLCFLATILPFSAFTRLPILLGAIGVGFAASAMVILFVFPENEPRLFVNNSNRFFQDLAQGLLDMRRSMLFLEETPTFEKRPYVSQKMVLARLLDSNQMLLNRGVFMEDGIESQVLMYQYSLLNTYSLLVDATHVLWERKCPLPRLARLFVGRKCKKFGQIFSSMVLRSSHQVILGSTVTLNTKLPEKLGHVLWPDPNLLMVLFQFKLGFDLFHQYLDKLLTGTRLDDAT